MARNVIIDIKARTSQYERALKRAGGQTDTFNAKLGRVGKKAAMGGLAAAAIGVAAIGAAAVKVGVQSATAFASFEKSLSQIEGLVGIAHESVMGFKDGIKELSVETARGPQELAEALFFITSAGLEGQEAMDALEVSAKAAAAGLGETATIADVVTSAMNAYGDNIDGAGEATDVLVAAVREGKAAAPELAGSLGRVIPIASQMGVSFDEVGASIAAMTRTGLNAAESSTALRSILNSLLAPGADAKRALDELGLSAEGLKQEIRDRGLFATLQHLTTAFDGQDEATSRVFGNVRALTGIMSLMGENAGATEEIFNSLAESTGSLDTAFGVAADTGAFAFEQAKARIETAMLDVGEQILPKLADAIDEIAPMLPDLIDGFGDLAIAMVDFGVGAVPKVVAGFEAIERGMLNFGIGQIELRKNIEGFNNVADVMLGPWINIPDVYGEASESQQKWLLTQREVIDLMKAGGETAQVAADALFHLGNGGDLTADRVAGLQARLGATNEEMALAGQRAIEWARANGVATVDIMLMENALLGVNEAAKDEGKAAAIAAASHEILGLSAHAAAAGIDAEAAALTGDVIPALSDFEQALTDAEAAQTSLADAVLAASDPTFKAVKAVQALEDAEEKLTEVREDEKATSEDVAAAQLAVVEAALKAQGALDALGGIEGMPVEAAIAAIKDVLGLTDDEARDLLESLNILDGTSVSTVVNITTIETTRRREIYDRKDALGLASGGSVTAGEPYIVGEEGEELFVPNTSGRIIPNGSFTQNQSSRSVVVNVYDSQHRDLAGDITTGLTRAGVQEQVDMIGVR